MFRTFSDHNVDQSEPNEDTKPLGKYLVSVGAREDEIAAFVRFPNERHAAKWLELFTLGTITGHDEQLPYMFGDLTGARQEDIGVGLAVERAAPLFQKYCPVDEMPYFITLALHYVSRDKIESTSDKIGALSRDILACINRRRCYLQVDPSFVAMHLESAVSQLKIARSGLLCHDSWRTLMLGVMTWFPSEDIKVAILRGAQRHKQGNKLLLTLADLALESGRDPRLVEFLRCWPTYDIDPFIVGNGAWGRLNIGHYIRQTQKHLLDCIPVNQVANIVMEFLSLSLSKNKART